MAKNTAVSSGAMQDGDPEGQHLTSGDIARMLHVDLKTIHNWVNQGHITGRRTKGRHLRFDRTEAVRFMRLYGYPVPEAVGEAAPKLLLHDVDGRSPWAKAARRGLEVTVFHTLSECLLAVADGDQEIVCLDLERSEVKRVREFIEALGAWPLTQGLTLIGVAEKPSVRRNFLAAGGHLALAASKAVELKNVAKWLTGAIESRPECCEQAEKE